MEKEINNPMIKLTVKNQNRFVYFLTGLKKMSNLIWFFCNFTIHHRLTIKQASTVRVKKKTIHRMTTSLISSPLRKNQTKMFLKNLRSSNCSHIALNKFNSKHPLFKFLLLKFIRRLHNTQIDPALLQLQIYNLI